MRLPTLIAAAVVAGLGIGGVATAGLLATEEQRAADATMHPHDRANRQFFRTCRRATRSGDKNVKRCRCLADAVRHDLNTVDEYRFAGEITRAILTTGRFMAKTRLQSKLRRLYKRYKDKMAYHRANAIWTSVTRNGLACARSVR